MAGSHFTGPVYSQKGFVGDVVYAPAGTGAVATTVQTKLQQTVSVFDFMTPAQIADVQAGTATLDVTTAIQTAIATSKDLVWPNGVYLISRTLTGIGAWVGQGQGNTYDSTYSGSGSYLKLSGTNSGNAFLKPPLDFSGFHIDGVTKTNIAIDLGQNGSFTAFQRWKNITIRRCADAMREYNFYSTALENVILQNNVRGITITPTDTVADDGYFNSVSWNNIHIADCDVYALNVNPPLGNRCWTGENVVIERNGATGGTYQAYLSNVTFTCDGLYLEGTNTVPSLKINQSTLLGRDWYVNNTGGIDASSANCTLNVKKLYMTTSYDQLLNFPSTAKITLENSYIQTDIRSGAYWSVLNNVTINGVTDVQNYRAKVFSVGQSPDSAYQPNEVRLTYSGQRTVTATISANSSVEIVANTYFPSITSDAVGFGQVEKYHPGLFVQITSANSTGSTDYYTVRLVNTTGASITITSEKVTWFIFRFNPAAV